MGIMGWIKRLFFDFLDLFYPSVCAGCYCKLNKEEKDLCLLCKSTLPKTGFHLIDENPVKKLFWGRIPLHHATSYLYFTKHSKVQNILHNIKYNGHRELAQTVGQMMGRELKNSEQYKDVDVIIPVPLHPKKLKKRGFNQSEHFGIGLAEAMELPLSVNNLIRQSNSSTQTKKNRFQRWENVSEIFAVVEPEKFQGKHLLLIDDVITTGATLEACYQALAKSGNIRLSMASIAVSLL
jgi:ComF family protein